MATQDEEAARLEAIGDKLDKAKAEILSAVEALRAALAEAGNTSAGVEAATARIEGIAQGFDDLNPDAA